MSFPEIKAKLLRLLRPPRQLKFTPEGTRFVIVALAIGVAAINTGNNLLYLILAMVLSMIILSGILSESSLRMVDILRSVPKTAFAGKPFLVKITAMNSKKLFPSISITFQDHVEGAVNAGSPYFLKVPPKGKEQGSYHLTLEKRGVHAFREGRLATRYPFGLFLKSKDAGGMSEILVYPKILDVRELLRETGVDGGEVESRIKGKGTDLYGLRGYVSGDDMRTIHWKTSARLSKLYVKEFAREDARRVTLFLDNCVPQGFDEQLERGVTVTASLAAHFLYKGYQVGLATVSDNIPMGIGMEQLYTILRTLALLKPGKDRERMTPRSRDAGGVLILPYPDEAWKGREELFSKVIRL